MREGRWYLGQGLAAACLLVALLLWIRPPVSELPMGATAPKGGCPSSASSFLRADPDIHHAAITYCANGDEARGTIELRLPANHAMRPRLAVAGYIDGHAVRLRIALEDDEESLYVIQRAGEQWQPLNIRVPQSWAGRPLRVVLDDQGTGFQQWAGIGMLPEPGRLGIPIMSLLLASILLSALALPPPRSEGVPTPPRKTPVRRTVSLVLLAASVALLAAKLYLGDVAGVWHHPDQSIPVKVMVAMHEHGDLNTDWARADLPEFHAFRYNFSGYIQAVYLTIKAIAPAAFKSEFDLLHYLLEFSRWSAALTLAVCLLLLVRTLGVGYALVGVLLVATTPQFLQDAHYARPEAWSTLLSTLAFALACLKPQQRWAQFGLLALLGMLAGVLTTIKFTYAVFSLYCVAAAWQPVRQLPGLTRKLQHLGMFGGASLAGVVFGICVGSPAIVADLPGFLAGIQALDHQYGGGHPPFGPMTHGLVPQWHWITGYYLATLGLPLVVLHVMGYFRTSLAPAKAGFLAVFAITFGAFLVQSVFFERNLTALIPAFMMVAVAGAANIERFAAARLALQRPLARRLLHLACMGLLVLAGAWGMSVSARLAPYFDRIHLQQILDERTDRLQGIAAEVGAVRTEVITYPQVLGMDLPPPSTDCVLFIGTSFNDDWSRRYYSQMDQSFIRIGRIASDFNDVPTGTLHIYHSPAYELFATRPGCRLTALPTSFH
ncbi:hypothetical protein [Stenotrophomonas maltophilia]|uniref:hypothetical protein n=1 Tax=Stenotrophomonas maltophilia TaxID=40324 RepID=UPI0010942E26|nr:hypothetical protein [Stenotrophomonas maltophilia]